MRQMNLKGGSRPAREVEPPCDISIDLLLKMRVPYVSICAGLAFKEDRIIVASVYSGELEYIEFTSAEYAHPSEVCQAILDRLHLREGVTEDFVEPPPMVDAPYLVEGTIVYDGPTIPNAARLPDSAAYKYFAEDRDQVVYVYDIGAEIARRYVSDSWILR